MSNNEFGLFDDCPYCNSKTEWVPNMVDGAVEFGKFKCKKCGAISGWHEITLEDS